MAVSSPFFGKREPQTFSTRPAIAVTNAPSSAPVEALRTAEPAPVTASTTAQGGSKLTVGPNIKLKGVEITDCDTLVVEGTVEATMDSRVIHIAQQGAFHGAADIDIAEVHGTFTGTLTVRQKLVIHSTGNVSGKIRYGHIVIEEGGQLSGEIEVGVGAALASSSRKISADSKSAAASSPITAAA